MSTDLNTITGAYLRNIDTLPDNETSLDEILREPVAGEQELRRLFASDPQHPSLRDPFYGLIDLFRTPATARRTRARPVSEADGDFARHYIFPLRDQDRRAHLAPSTVPTLDEFLACWGLFSHGVLSMMTAACWQNVIVAGGSILAALMAQHPPKSSPEEINNFYLGNAWGSSDIDVFLWGLSTEEAILKIRSIYSAIAQFGWRVTCVRKANVISIHTMFPHRPVQIVLRLYATPSQVLAGFDVDAACCAFDGGYPADSKSLIQTYRRSGRTVWVNPRSLAAIIRQANTFDITRRSPSYEIRLAKYAERGFEVYLPTLSRARIRPSLYDEHLRVFPRGLARLLVLERLSRDSTAYVFLKYPRNRVQVERTVTSADEDPFEGITEDTPNLNKSFYESDLRWCQIPFGPGWDASRIEKAVAGRDVRINSSWNRANRGCSTHKHVIFAGSLDKCISGEFCEKCIEDSSGPHTNGVNTGVHIHGPLKFMVENPGRQILTGSFQPIDDEEWEAEAYASASQIIEYQESLSEILHNVTLFQEATDLRPSVL